VSAAYRNSYFPVDRLHEHHVALATARAGNVIGGGDWSEHRLIPDLIRGFKLSNLCHPAAKATRPWQHVLDPLHAHPAEKPCSSNTRSCIRVQLRPALKMRGLWSALPPSLRNVGEGASWIRDPDTVCTRATLSHWTPAKPAQN